MKKIIAVAALVAAGVPTAALGQAARPTSGVVFAGVTHPEGNDLYVAGDIKDKVLGRGAIVYITRIAPGEEEGSVRVNARKITIYTPKGSLSGSGSATQTVKDGKTTVTDGTFRLTKGTQKLKGMKMSGTFSGEQTNGVYRFDYEGAIGR
jgi:hypothetical protein